MTGAGLPEQTTLARGMELTPLSDQWLQSMGGMQALFGDLARPGTAGDVTVQIVRSSGTALHALEKKGCKELGLNLDDASCLQPYWERNQPMHSILDAMVNCIASARAFVYLQEQFMAEPSVVNDYVTSSVGRHNVENAMKALKAGESRVKGFWVAMPLLWGNGMDDPAATVPNEIIAALPRGTGLRGGAMLARQSVDEGHGEQA